VPEETAGLTASDLRKSENVMQIKASTGAEIPQIMGVINAIPKGEKRTPEQIIKELTGV
jgi:hypothetical protein